MITLENIQTRLIQAIRESALKQKDIAKQLNVDPSNISHYVNSSTQTLRTFFVFPIDNVVNYEQ